MLNDIELGDVPMLRVLLSSTDDMEYVVERLTSRIVQTRINTAMSVGVDYFNVELSTWEPLLEYWAMVRTRCCEIAWLLGCLVA